MNLKEFWHPYIGALSITFDDAAESQLQKAIPAMNTYGIRGSFYLSLFNDTGQKEIQPWKEVAALGHEIGNHTLSHFCSYNLCYNFFESNRLVETQIGLESRSIIDIEEDILAAKDKLLHIAPHQKHWTFAYPCYQTFIGKGKSRQSYVPVIAKHFLSGRGGGEYGMGNDPGNVDLSCTIGLPTDRMSGFEMIGLVEALAAKGLWVILIFHEIDGKRLSVCSSDFELLLGYLKRNAERIWTAPVVEIAQKIANFQKTQCTVLGE